MEMKTYLRKSLHNGWQCETNVDLGNKLRLKVSTYKSAKHIVSIASVCTVEGAFETHKMHEDFWARLEAHKNKCTEKNVQAVHAQALDRLPEFMPEIAKQYGLKIEA